MKLNNKGFAISTVIYGLAIMGILLVAMIMATMATTRSNSRQLAKSIEEELNRFNKIETFFGKSIDNENKPLSQEYIVPTTGWYKIELWGSSGSNGSKGAYTSGVTKLNEGDILYFYIGKANTGKETDVRVENGLYNDSYSASTRIMVAAGGGSGTGAAGGTLYGYNNNMISIGGIINSSTDGDYKLIPPGSKNNETNGTLLGFKKSYSNSSITYPAIGGEVVPSPLGSNGGGDGFYPSNNSSIGGTSYIAGYAGCKGFNTSNGKLVVSKDPKATIYKQEYNTTTDTGEAEKYGAVKGTYYFIDGIMIANSNGGNGKAKIERVSTGGENIAKKNSFLAQDIIGVMDCVDSSSPTTKNISAISGGNEMVTSSLFSSNDGGLKCMHVNTTKAPLDEIAIWHDAGTDPKNEVIKVNISGKGWVTIRDGRANTNISESETVTGIRISAYQNNTTEPLPDVGTYYLMSVLSENQVISATSNTEQLSNTLVLEPMQSAKRQRWTIEAIKNEDGTPTGEYKLYESARYYAFQILEDENKLGNRISADTIFNKHAKDETQWWDIIPVGNGTYIINTKINSLEGNTGYVTNIKGQTSSEKDRIEIGRNEKTTARFKLISTSY